MRNYNDYKKDSKKDILSQEELSKVEFIKYKIIVPTQEDKEELEQAFEHIHYSNINTDYVAVNQIAHEYLNESEGYKNNIIVDKKLYEQIS
jgi:hypothetical protein